MLTEADKPDYALPMDFDGLTWLRMSMTDSAVQLRLVTAVEMQRLRSVASVSGAPMYAAIMGEQLCLHSPPDAVYFIEVIYQPKLKVF